MTCRPSLTPMIRACRSPLGMAAEVLVHRQAAAVRPDGAGNVDAAPAVVELGAHIEVDVAVVAAPQRVVDEQLPARRRPVVPAAAASASCANDTSSVFSPVATSTRKMPSSDGCSASLVQSHAPGVSGDRPQPRHPAVVDRGNCPPLCATPPLPTGVSSKRYSRTRFPPSRRCRRARVNTLPVFGSRSLKKNCVSGAAGFQ